ncbi:uncharacterized protein HD556DRAFT_1311725 [Suillus plorans]|uniref:Uncharacterized protein n=1 Tax=Suillus plorans TaxID=116603 RepID=A0A9P7AGJ3_9AGAM|nr:uncharacterized protein HD556DRAFT_1311725 [Suillus plorans]KAG1788980.1 hypothetical protein HD556DRAFT_1311725 [Suillus plorans]
MTSHYCWIVMQVVCCVHARAQLSDLSLFRLAGASYPTVSACCMTGSNAVVRPGKTISSSYGFCRFPYSLPSTSPSSMTTALWEVLSMVDVGESPSIEWMAAYSFRQDNIIFIWIVWLSGPTTFNLAIQLLDNIVIIWIVRLSGSTAFNLTIQLLDNIVLIWIVRLSGPTAFNLAIQLLDNIVLIWIVRLSGPTAFNLAIQLLVTVGESPSIKWMAAYSPGQDNIVLIWIVRLSGPTAFNLAIQLLVM